MATEPRPVPPLIPPEKRVENPPNWTPEESERLKAVWLKIGQERREAKKQEAER